MKATGLLRWDFIFACRYEYVITLPEPVQGSDMKVDRNGHEVVITIPKAENA